MVRVTVEPITSSEEMRIAISHAYQRDSNQSLGNAYLREHSIIRLMMFRVRLYDIPSKVSVHLVRHSAVGQFHLVGSNRGDWNPTELSIEEWDKTINRGSPVNHYMMLNADHLITMSRKRLCTCSEEETRRVMEMIKKGVREIDKDLADFMVPDCWYRGGICTTTKECCGINQGYPYYRGYKERSL